MGQEVQKISVLWLQFIEVFVLEVLHSNRVRYAVNNYTLSSFMVVKTGEK